jgi:hypothetical protein
MTEFFTNEVKRYLPWATYEFIFNKLSENQRGEIDWYLLKLAIKCSKQSKNELMHLYISRFHQEQIQKFGLKSIYHEENA